MEQNTSFNAPAAGNNNTSGRNQKKPDAYLGNARIIDANGNEHNFNAYLPVFADQNQLQRSIVEAAKLKEAEGDDEAIELTMKVRVNLAKIDDGTNIPLF